MVNGMATTFRRAVAVLFMAFSTVAVSAPCDPEQNTWIPSRYYPPGKTVFHHGAWYESRELHEGKTPGADFEWKKLESAPDCHGREGSPVAAGRENKPQQPQAPGQKRQHPEEARNKARLDCNDPGRWSFGASYTVGQMAVHEGQTYRAIRPSNGHMPGMSQPPHWQPVDHPCGD